jgi:tetratricopeptide (TPR) repeat protein
VSPGAALLALSLLAIPGVRAPGDALSRADASWARRADGQVDARARPGPIDEAIEAYEAALAERPRDLEIHWKLQRAFWFRADFASADGEEERALYERAIAASERAFALVAERVGGEAELERMEPARLRERLPAADRTDAAHLYFWSAINLGAWSRLAGLFQAVRAGVASRLHQAALRSIELDPGVEQGGAIRLLSRLHSELPRVPLLSGWVDPSRAVPLAERALAEYPEHPGNSYLLALALLDHAPERRAEALERIARTAELRPRADHVVEDIAIRIAARELLERRRASDSSRGAQPVGVTSFSKNPLSAFSSSVSRPSSSAALASRTARFRVRISSARSKEASTMRRTARSISRAVASLYGLGRSPSAAPRKPGPSSAQVALPSSGIIA